MKSCAEAAGRVLDGLDQACRALVVTGCFDEIFFHGKPVLVGVEPHSMAWVLAEHAADRSGSTWTKALQGFDALEPAVVDGGRGLQRGLVDFQKQRQNAGNSTPLEVSLDVFHTKQEAQRVLRKLWNRLESQWARAEEADRRGDRRGFGAAAAKAWKKVERLMERYDRAERAWKRIEAALELFRPDGRLNDRAWATGEIAAAVKELDGPEWGKVRRSLTFLDRMQHQLTTTGGVARGVAPTMVAAAAVGDGGRRRSGRRTPTGRRAGSDGVLSEGGGKTGRSRIGGWRRCCDTRFVPAVRWSA